MYEIALDEAWELFGEHLDGSRAGLVLVASSTPLADRSRRALDSAMASLGYGTGACAFATTEGLDDQALFLLVEGIDPLCLVAADEGAAHALGRTFRCDVPVGKPGRAFGRSVAAFRDFDAMLDDGQDKQVAWALLKKLPKFTER